jgi:hypothetical protein
MLQEGVFLFQETLPSYTSQWGLWTRMIEFCQFVAPFLPDKWALVACMQAIKSLHPIVT